MMHRTANIMEAVASFSKYPHRTGDMDSPRTIIFCAPRYTPLCSFGVIFIINKYSAGTMATSPKDSNTIAAVSHSRSDRKIKIIRPAIMDPTANLTYLMIVFFLITVLTKYCSPITIAAFSAEI